ncbi:hypothetical protein [Ferrimicrobium sp.]|uniref:hypothetical protein n=1 Tax=Ferrimicrobium sp. TaxID=2926050 RepID=UPI00260816C5|nr:hypothetical protein [Ferrimicrobium sp.]
MGAVQQQRRNRTPAGATRSLYNWNWLITMVVLSLVLTACGTTATAQLTPIQAKGSITRAYRDTIATGGYAVRASIHETLGRETLDDTAQLTGTVTTDPPAARLEVPTPRGGMQEQLTIGDTQYVPTSSTSHPDHVTKWLAFAVTPQASLTDTGTSSSKNALAPLPFLIDPAMGQIHKIGQAKVSGVPTIEFQTHLLSRLEEPPPLPRSGDSIGPPVTKALTHVILSIWITHGTKPLIKQLEIVQQAMPDHEKLRTVTIVTLSHYGLRPPIAPPPISEVTVLPPSTFLSSGVQTPSGEVLQPGPAIPTNPIFTPIRNYANTVPIAGVTTVNDHALVLDEEIHQESELVRFDPTNGTIEARTQLSTIEATTYADGELWVLTSVPNQTSTSTIEVLNPDTLTMLYRRTLPVTANLAADAASIAVVGKRVWISTNTGIVGLDADLRHSTSITIARPATLSIEVAADGSALLTSLCGDGGSSVTIQVRNPISGDLISSLNAELAGIGGAAMAPTTNRVWFRVATGMMGTLGFVDLTAGNPPTLLPGSPVKNGTGIDDRGFPNTLRVTVAGPAVFAYDSEVNVLECRNVETGLLLTTTQNLNNVRTVTGLPNDEIAVTLGKGEITIARISSLCLG